SPVKEAEAAPAVSTDETPLVPQNGSRQHDMTTGDVAGRILKKYLKPHSTLIVAAILANALVAATTGVLPFLIEQTVELVFNQKRQDMLIYIPMAALAIQLVKAAATYGSNVVMSFVGQRMVSTIQTQLFARLMTADLGWIQQTHSGRFISTFMTDVIRLRDATSQSIINLTRHLLTLVVLIGYMYYLDWLMAVIATAVIPIAAVLMRKLGRKTRKATNQGLEETGSLSTLISEALTGIRVVKAYGQEEHEIARARNVIDRVLDHMMNSIRAKAAASPITEALTGVGIAAVIYYAGVQSFNGTMTAGSFFGFMAAVMLAYQPLKAVANQQTLLQEGVAAAARVFPILDVQAKIDDADDACELVAKQGTIRLEHVTFRYDDGTKALDDVNIHVPAGQTVALVGPSGAGKSTILNLVPRFYDVSEGTVSIDGQPIRSVTLASLRQASALVTQEPFLFDDTVRANIAYGMPDATDTAIEAAARNAAAHEFIMALPLGYETLVGEAGLKLSGGQRQRIAIARAMLKNAPILLLDEATSALDTASELQVQNALQTLMQGRTTLVIAHRLSTIMHADNIYVIDQGRVLEQGTHQELVARGGLYAELSRSQFNSDNENLSLSTGTEI
ncbi:MAG: ABC transporter ATP-binding protein, partial [Parvibaculum sp.]